ncbi:MAG: hypothetical protein GY909_11330 [Oligoflexia bacterium]|nr:hypothetical protein [Oligoflexia bacterium]
MEDDLFIEKLMTETYETLEDSSDEENVIDLKKYFENRGEDEMTGSNFTKVCEFLDHKEISFTPVKSNHSFYRIHGLTEESLDIPSDFGVFSEFSGNENHFLFVNKENDESMFFHAVRPLFSAGLMELIFIKVDGEIMLIPLMDYHLRFKGEILSFFDEIIPEVETIKKAS